MALVLALLLISPTTFVTGQSSILDRQFDLSMGPLTVNGYESGDPGDPVPIVVGEDNVITGTVTNNGDVPVEAVVFFSACGGDGECVDADEVDRIFLSDDDPEPFMHEWRNEEGEEPHLASPVSIRMEVVQAEEVTIRQALGDDGDPSSDIDEGRQTWDNVWDENVSLVRDAEEAPDDGTGKSLWDFAWGQAEGAHETVGENLFPEEDPERIDPDPSNNVREVLRNVVEHETELDVRTEIGDETLSVDDREVWTTEVWVFNRGTADDTVTLSLENGISNWTFDLDATTLAITAGSANNPPSPEKVHVTMQGPTSAPEGQQGTVELVATSQNAPETGGARTTLYSPPVATTGDIAVAITPLTSSVPAEDSERSTSFDVEVTNRQNSPIDFGLQMVSPVDWPGTVSIDPDPEDPDTSMTLESEQSSVFTVSTTVPGDTVAGLYSFSAIAHYNSESLEAPTPHVLSVLQYHGIDFSVVSADEIDPGPEGDSSVLLHMENLGNGPDTFDIAFDQAPEGWSLSNATGGSDTQFTLDAFEERDISFRVEVPSDTEPGEQPVKLKVVSQQDPEAFRAVLHPMDVQGRVFPRIDVGACPVPQCALDAGDSMTVDLILRNIGNEQGTLRLAVVVDEESGKTQGPNQDGWVVSVEPATVTIGRDGSAQATLTVQAPDTDSLDSQDQAVVALTLQATDDHTHDGNTTTEHLLVRSAFPDLVVGAEEDFATDPDPLYRNLDGELLVPVENTGARSAGPFSVQVTYTSGSDEFEETAAVAGLDAGSSTMVPVRVPTKAGFDEFSVLIEVDADDEVDEYVESATSNDLESTLALRTFDIQITSPGDLDIDPKESVPMDGDLGFIVENLDDDMESVSVVLSADPAWTSKTWNNVELEPGQDPPPSFGKTFHIPDRPQTYTGTVTLQVMHTVHGEDLMKEASFTIHVNDTFAPDILSVASSHSEIARGSSVNLTAHVEDVGGVEEVKAFIKSPIDDGVEQFPMTYDASSDRYSATVQFTTPGQHQWHVWARDGAMHENDTSGDPQNITVQSASKPVLELVTPDDGSIIRPGEPVAVSVSNTTGIQSATATVHGTETTLSATTPLTINTDDWSDGDTPVLVNVTDQFGTAVNLSFTYMVDGTPPTISGVEFSSTEPGDPTVVEVKVTDNTSVASVRLRVDPGGGKAATDMDMEPDGSVFSSETTYPGDGGSLTVMATDVAGNTASRLIAGEGADADSDIDGASGSRGIPSVGPVAFGLALLGLAGLCLRRQQRDGGQG